MAQKWRSEGVGESGKSRLSLRGSTCVFDFHLLRKTHIKDSGTGVSVKLVWRLHLLKWQFVVIRFCLDCSTNSPSLSIFLALIAQPKKKRPLSSPLFLTTPLPDYDIKEQRSERNTKKEEKKRIRITDNVLKLELHFFRRGSEEITDPVREKEIEGGATPKEA